jgi:hypothetical protein
MVGPPFGWGDDLGRPSGAEQDPEGLLEPPRAVTEVDVGRQDLPLWTSRIGKALAHRDTSGGITMADAPQPGYKPRGRRGV